MNLRILAALNLLALMFIPAAAAMLSAPTESMDCHSDPIEAVECVVRDAKAAAHKHLEQLPGPVNCRLDYDPYCPIPCGRNLPICPLPVSGPRGGTPP